MDFVTRLLDILPPQARAHLTRLRINEWTQATQATLLRSTALRPYWNKMRTHGMPAWTMNHPQRLHPLVHRDFTGADFSLMQWAYTTWTHYNLTDASFVGANLRGANYNTSDIERTDFRFSNLSTAKLPSTVTSGQLHYARTRASRVTTNRSLSRGYSATLTTPTTRTTTPSRTSKFSPTPAQLWDPYVDPPLNRSASVLVLCCPPTLKDTWLSSKAMLMWHVVYGHTRVVWQDLYYPVSTEELSIDLRQDGHTAHLAIFHPDPATLTFDLVPHATYSADFGWKTVRAQQWHARVRQVPKNSLTKPRTRTRTRTRTQRA